MWCHRYTTHFEDQHSEHLPEFGHFLSHFIFEAIVHVTRPYHILEKHDFGWGSHVLSSTLRHKQRELSVSMRRL